MMRAAWIVLRKELLDALRDRRTLLMVLLSSVAIGPLVLVLLSTLVSGMEERAETRQVLVAGIEHAPTLRNYLERQTYQVVAPPPDYERQLVDNSLGDPVLVIGPAFEAELQRGEPPRVEIVGSSANPRANAGSSRLARLLGGFQHEQVTLRLAWRGVAPAALQAIEIDERDLASPAARAALPPAPTPARHTRRWRGRHVASADGRLRPCPVGSCAVRAPPAASATSGGQAAPPGQT